MGGNRRNSCCSFDMGEGDDLPLSLREALAHLTPHRVLLEELSISGAKLRFFVGWFSEGLNSRELLGWELLRDIAALRIALDLDFYGPDEGERAAS